MYIWLALCLSLAALLLFNALGTLATTLIWRIWGARAQQWNAQDRARALFALRTAPLLGAALFIKLFLLPAYLTYEPHTAEESLSWPLLVAALASLTGLALAVWRGLAAWWVTRRLVRDWLANSAPLTLEGVKIPAYRLRHPFPVVALVGVTRPRLFVAEQLLEEFDAEEIAATLRHELSHLATHDNLKRAWLRVCGDVLTLVPCGRELDRAWAEAVELAADENAAQAGATVSLNLASALLKIARLTAPGTQPALLSGAFLLGVGTTKGALATRVRYLARLAEVPAAPHQRLGWDAVIWSGLATFAALLLLAAWQTSALAQLHFLIEHLVNL